MGYFRIVNLGTGWCETELAAIESLITAIMGLERKWILCHGARECFPADGAYEKREMYKLLLQHHDD